jgi:hypothetical protein
LNGAACADLAAALASKDLVPSTAVSCTITRRFWNAPVRSSTVEAEPVVVDAEGSEQRAPLAHIAGSRSEQILD